MRRWEEVATALVVLATLACLVIRTKSFDEGGRYFARLPRMRNLEVELAFAEGWRHAG